MQNRITIPNISIEVTRKCNLKCRHCCRGEAQNKDISPIYFDILLNQVNYIDHLTFTGGEPSLNTESMNLFIDKCVEKGVKIRWISIVTNGIRITQDFVDVCDKMYSFAKLDVCLSDDKFHLEQKRYNDSLLRDKPYYRKQSSIRNFMLKVLKEGRGAYLKEASCRAGAGLSYNFLPNEHITLNVEGQIIRGIDWSYMNQKKFYLCDVDKIEKLHNKTRCYA